MSTDIGSESEDEHDTTDIVLAKCDSSDSLCSSDEEPIQDQDAVTNEDDIYY